MTTYRKAPFRGRDNLSKFLVRQGAGEDSIAIEIGVHRGGYAKKFLRHWPGWYLGVDPYEADLPGYDGDVLAVDRERVPCFGRNRQPDLDIATLNLQPYPKASLLTVTSKQAAKIVPDDLFCVYIDANHKWEYVAEDIRIWLPKLRVGGFLSGHDYGTCKWGPQIAKAINLTLPNAEVFVIQERSSTWSWYTVKK